MSKPTGDDIPDALRNCNASLERKQAHGLTDEERIAIGLLVQGRDQLRGRELRRGELHVLGDVVLAQPGERDASGDRLASDLDEHRGECVRRSRIDVAKGAEQQHAGRAELAGEVLQEQERRRVGRVQVVEDEQQRTDT